MTVEGAFFTQEKTCPICRQIFQATRVRSSFIRIRERKADFMIIYDGVNPIHYQIFVCPSCYYASQENNFDSPYGDTSKVARELFLLRQQEPNFLGVRSLPVVLRAFELAIRTAQISQAPASVSASLYLKCAWLAREMQDETRSLVFIKESLKLYEKAYASERSVGKMSSSTLSYLIGELYRQIGTYDEAIRWFSRTVMQSSAIKSEPEIERLARDQWALAREQSKALGNDSIPNEQKDSTEKVESSSSSTVEPPIKESPVRKARGPKVRLTATLHEEQVTWLKEISATPYRESKTFMEREAVLRALIDAAMEVYPSLQGFSNEDELRDQLIDKMKKGNDKKEAGA
ncbi:DUF2225 domain-containing protein [Heliorestis acidaminivorans]|uniref:DUF2225 domain-containing protein n=1 Tax=Heliorestis acidaminivorans TaxID=553427 RepID=A0A6I0F9V5_9FIRM|nr:DUF2225 domain-containing protein [Heliorestis acidaminivorans]KAB2954318.1 DUF2225 domain-containing protein [Heliorestis acidaminivorans]